MNKLKTTHVRCKYLYGTTIAQLPTRLENLTCWWKDFSYQRLQEESRLDFEDEHIDVDKNYDKALKEDKARCC